MPNMGKIISSLNSKLLNNETQQQKEEETCNCLGGPDTCPLTPAECKKNNVIYVASVTSQDGVEHYTGLTGAHLKRGGTNIIPTLELGRKPLHLAIMC